MTTLNGQNVTQLNQFIETVRQDRARADRHLQLAAHWVGGDRARVECEGKILYIGGEGELNAMRVLLAALAACDVEVIATHASLMGLEIETLSVEAGGHFNVCSYLGLPNAPGSGYDGISYTIRARIPDTTPEQLSQLRRQMEAGSPAGDSLERAIPLKLHFEVHA
jgi:hypothetical protein